MRPRLAPDPTPAHRRTGSRWWDAPGELRGINLRSWLVLELAAQGGTVEVADLAARVESSGMRVGGRASKTISDALRWEVRRGRAVRIERGRYALGRLSGATGHRMARRLAACRVRATAVRPAPAGAEPLLDERPEVREAREIFASFRTVAQRRNEPEAPSRTESVTAGRPPPHDSRRQVPPAYPGDRIREVPSLHQRGDRRCTKRSDR